MKVALRAGDVFGFIKPALDAHTLGLSVVMQLLADCGVRAVTADQAVSRAAEHPELPESVERLEGWLRSERVTRLGFSYRLDARMGAALFQQWLSRLEQRRLLAEHGGPLVAVYFAGLPEACALVRRAHGERVAVFAGDETPGETLDRLGVPPARRPATLSQSLVYDEARHRFSRDLVAAGRYLEVQPVDRSGYPEFGSARDSLAARLQHGNQRGLPPLLRAHMGQYGADRDAAVRDFLEHTRQVARAGLLDVLSIGTSQLTQAAFGEAWGERPNGGGVPINSADELRAAWAAARPMLVRIYAGTRDIPRLARLYEETLHIAWHTLSFWWFSQLDGRGPNQLLDNLREHFAALGVIARSGKPFEPNVPHHFAFRGADDVTYVVAGVLAARAAKAAGIRLLVLQVMLNTPKGTWGVQDLAKARALLMLVRELEDGAFRAVLQPRAGLDLFSPDPTRAKEQLAAVTALMDDIEPDNPRSPGIIHVVGYSEATHLADPGVVNESAQLSLAALAEYRRLRARGEVEDMAQNEEAARRTTELLVEARAVLAAIEQAIPEPSSAAGLHRAFAAGFLPVPYLWACREQYPLACAAATRLVDGGVRLVDETGVPVAAGWRAGNIAESVLAQAVC